MKKILSLVFMVAAMMYATSANAQIKFGLKGGLNVTSMSFSEDVLMLPTRLVSLLVLWSRLLCLS